MATKKQGVLILLMSTPSIYLVAQEMIHCKFLPKLLNPLLLMVVRVMTECLEAVAVRRSPGA